MRQLDGTGRAFASRKLHEDRRLEFKAAFAGARGLGQGDYAEHGGGSQFPLGTRHGERAARPYREKRYLSAQPIHFGAVMRVNRHRPGQGREILRQAELLGILGEARAGLSFLYRQTRPAQGPPRNCRRAADAIPRSRDRWTRAPATYAAPVGSTPAGRPPGSSLPCGKQRRFPIAFEGVPFPDRIV